MSQPLTQRLREAKRQLDQVHLALGRQPGALPSEVEAAFRAIVDHRADIDHWLTLLDARTAALALLAELELQADADDLVPFGAVRVKYRHVRLIGVQAYVATTWALADRISGMVGRVLCTPDSGFNHMSPVHLVTHFVQKDRKKTTAAGLFESVRRSFGWPIGISYAIRNHIIHDGAQVAGSDLFEAADPASAFRMSTRGWNRIERRAEEMYGVDASLCRANANWPSSPCDDLRTVLATCERETDEALGIVLGSACQLLCAHVGLMLGED